MKVDMFTFTIFVSALCVVYAFYEIFLSIGKNIKNKTLVTILTFWGVFLLGIIVMNLSEMIAFVNLPRH